MHIKCRLVTIALWIKVIMQHPAGATSADDLDAANFDNPVPFSGLKACGFGIQYNLSHLPCTPVIPSSYQYHDWRADRHARFRRDHYAP